MQHLSIVSYGAHLGLRYNRLLVKEKDKSDYREYPLNTLKTITLLKGGLSMSSDLLLACAARGIRVFLADFRGEIVSCLSGAFDHAVAGTRKLQFEKFQSNQAISIAKKIIAAKIANQRAVLLYFSKSRPEVKDILKSAAHDLEDFVISAENLVINEHWRVQIMGIEGAAAKLYFEATKNSGLVGETFKSREGRGSSETINSAMNYGYAILQTTIWTSVITAGLEPWLGFLHTPRPGKPALILDLMEEYRPWVVDRTVFKMGSFLEKEKTLSDSVRKRLITDINKVLYNHYPYKGRRVRLNTIIQRQIYRLVGELAGQTTFQPYRFKW